MQEKLLKWFEYLQNERGYSSHTISSYEDDLNSFADFYSNHLGQMIDIKDLEAFSLADFRSWLSFRFDKYDANSTKRAVSALKNFLKYLYRNKLITNEIFHIMKAPKAKKTLPRAISEENIEYLFANMKENYKHEWIYLRDIALFRLLYITGMRISEALSIKLKDLDDEILIITGKGQKQRVVPLLAQTREEISKYLKALPYSLEGENHIFRSLTNKKLSDRLVRKTLQSLREFYILPKNITPHAFRHSFATELLSHGADLRSVQELLGHSQLSSTEKYTKIDKNRLLKAYNQYNPSVK